jgi:hypothetical protein
MRMARVTIPTAITDAMLTSTNVTEDDHDEWDSATDYVAEDFVIVAGSTHKIYQAVQASGPGSTVVDPTTDTDSSHWLEVSATNRWKPFDNKSAIQCERAASIAYTFGDLGLTDGVALYGLDAINANLTITRDAVEVYNETIDLVNDDAVLDWYDYFFEPITYRDRAEFEEVPPYSDAVYALTINNPSATAKVGQIVLGRRRAIGDSLYSPRLGFLDFSTKERDAFGNAFLLQREFSQTVDYQVKIPESAAGRIFSLLAGLRATPAGWSAGDDTDDLGTTVFGYLDNFDILIEKPEYTELSLKVQELR